MIGKIFKVMWFFSLLGLLFVFFYVYAGLGEEVTLYEGTTSIIISRNELFYFMLLLATVINVSVFVIGRVVSKEKINFKGWFYGLIATINFFLIIVSGFISIINLADRYDYYKMGPAIYGSVILIGLWLIGWPIYKISQKYSKQQID